jgi:hypothetical protein
VLRDRLLRIIPPRLLHTLICSLFDKKMGLLFFGDPLRAKTHLANPIICADKQEETRENKQQVWNSKPFR